MGTRQGQVLFTADEVAAAVCNALALIRQVPGVTIDPTKDENGQDVGSRFGAVWREIMLGVTETCGDHDGFAAKSDQLTPPTAHLRFNEFVFAEQLTRGEEQ